MSDQDRASNIAAAQNLVDLMKGVPGSDAPEPEFEPVDPTGSILGGCDIDHEVPAGAMANYERWKADVEAGEPEAVATYGRLRPGPLKEIEHVTFIADRIDDRDPAVERAIVDDIFGAPYGEPMHALMRHEFMRRREETEHAVERLRLRLVAGCAAPGDAERVQACAAYTINDRLMVAFCWAISGQKHFGFNIEECRYVTSTEDTQCYSTLLPIPAGEKFAILGITDNAGVPRHLPISQAAVWCLRMLQDNDLGYELSLAKTDAAANS